MSNVAAARCLGAPEADAAAEYSALCGSSLLGTVGSLMTTAGI